MRFSHLSWDKHAGFEVVLLLVKRPCVAWAFACAAMLFLAVAILCGAPQTAQAKSFSMPSVDIQATVQANGDLQVTEKRTFDFDGSYSAVWWTYDSLPNSGTLSVQSLTMTPTDESGNATGSSETLSSVPFQTQWRTSGGPDGSAYSVDLAQNSIYAFFSVDSECVTFEVTYTVTDAAAKYSDVGELYWQFVGSGWEEDSSNVSCVITLPKPADASVVAGDNVRAWGHGPLDASVSVNDDGTVSYSVPNVSAGSYAEARILFPADWLSEVKGTDSNAYPTQSHLDSAVNEEITWSDQANAQRMQQLIAVLVALAVCLAALAWGLWSFVRYGKELKPTFTDEYWRDEPAQGVHPAVIGRLMRFDAQSNSDFTVTILGLVSQGAIRLERGAYQTPNGLVEEYYLTRIPEVALRLNSQIDQEAMLMLFDVIGGGRQQIWLSEIASYAELHPENYNGLMESWQGILTSHVMQQEYFETYSKSKRFQMMGVAILLLVACFMAGIVLDNLITIAVGFVAAAVLFVVSMFMDRRTQKGADDYARAEALKKWLTNFTALGERPVSDVKVWGKFMVYAYLFGVADEVVKELRSVAPEMFADDAYTTTTYSYVPWWVCYSTTWEGSNIEGFGQAMGSSIVQSAQAVSSALSGGSSDGFGGGGGFSGGGGGGFGGGGGAR